MLIYSSWWWSRYPINILVFFVSVLFCQPGCFPAFTLKALFCTPATYNGSSLVTQMVKASAYNAGDPGSIPGSGRSPGEGATHSSTFAWKIPWTEEPGGLQSVGSQRVGHDWATSLTHSLTLPTIRLPLSLKFRSLCFFKWMAVMTFVITLTNLCLVPLWIPFKPSFPGNNTVIITV